jgi:hypothetical protein
MIATFIVTCIAILAQGLVRLIDMQASASGGTIAAASRTADARLFGTDHAATGP